MRNYNWSVLFLFNAILQYVIFEEERYLIRVCFHSCQLLSDYWNDLLLQKLEYYKIIDNLSACCFYRIFEKRQPK